MLKKILLALAGALAILAAVVALRPAEYRVERSAAIAAPPAAVFAEVNDFRRWAAWSPWEKIDPAMKRTFEGPPSGVGAKYAWAGNKDVGEGRMTIVESVPGERIGIRIEFLKPFASAADVGFAFAPEAGGTRATWSMRGENDFVGKAFGLAFNMDAMIGADYERGLAAMKAVAEAAASAAPATSSSPGSSESGTPGEGT